MTVRRLILGILSILAGVYLAMLVDGGCAEEEAVLLLPWSRLHPEYVPRAYRAHAFSAPFGSPPLPHSRQAPSERYA